MIRYNNRIDVNRSPTTGELSLTTDRGQHWRASVVKNTATPWTTWWERQYDSEWRRDQMDYFLKTFANTYQRWDYLNKPTLYVLYQKGGGYNQDHDMALMQIAHSNVWFFSTHDHTWITRQPYDNFVFDISSALGSIAEGTVRQQLYEIDDNLLSMIRINEAAE